MTDRDTPASRAYEYVPLSELDGAVIRIAVAPFESVFVHTIDALTSGGLGSRMAAGRAPAASLTWRDAVSSRLTARDVEVLQPLIDPRTLGWPSCLAPTQEGSLTMEEALAEVADRTGAELATAVVADAAADRRALSAWEPVLRDPDRWLRSYVGALRRAWLGFEPLWRQSAGLLEREQERVAAAAARGATSHLVDALHPYSSIADDEWRLFERPDTIRMGLRDHRLTVAPLLGESVCITDCDDAGRLRTLSYPLPGAWRAFDEDRPPPASLLALIGDRRATLLQRLDRPATAGALATALGLVPGGLTPHLQALESSGLVRRERQGRHVMVHRTARGTELLVLYETP